MRRGWFGNSYGHSLAAKGMRMYARKDQMLMDPVFYAKKKEQQIPLERMMQGIREGKTFYNLVDEYPEADREDIRKKAIRVIDARDGHETLHMLDSNGVDVSVRMATLNPRLRLRMIGILDDRQKSSFLPDQKVQLLRGRLG